jgi:primosomal protein N' (replication factor Y)
MTGDSPGNRIVEVLLPLALETAYSYSVPQDMELSEGDYVQVPLGPRRVTGVVWSCNATPPGNAKLRDVITRYDLPPMPKLHRDFVDWLAAYYIEPAGQILRMCLRAPGAFEGPREQLAYRATGDLPDRMTPQRQRVIDVAADGMALRPRELAEMAGVGAGVVRGLAEAGALEPVALPALPVFSLPDPLAARVCLSEPQELAAASLRQAVTARKFSASLLDGVTGSGKTEVYFEAMAASLVAGKQVLLLLPEIALTGQFIARVEERFGAAPAEWHSDVRPRERERVWRAVATGEARITVGARSALFLPWASLGLIVVDEEHEPAFKQDDGASYHARDMAVVYAALGNFPVVLASATPSLESLVNVDRGRYHHITLADRHGHAELPEISLIDLRQEPPPSGQWLSQPLHDVITETLAAGDQALLFLNRRGYAPLTLCRTCGHRLECPNCSTWLVEHRFRRQLMCHHCGHVEPVPNACPQCRNEDTLVPCGPGVERLAEEAAAAFPDARLAILSSDLQRGAALRATIADVAKGNYDLIIGTQLVAKGHHFPGLTLVGVIDADLALETSDPRAGERTWQLMAQVAGRAGRGDKPGRALVQTYIPDHPLMQALKDGDRERFISHEKTIRQAAGLPPYGQLAGIIVSGSDAGETERFVRALAGHIPLTRDVHVLGPAPAPMHMVRGRYRWRYLVKCDRNVDIQAFLRSWLSGIKPRGSIRLAIDIDPYSFM